MQALGKIGYCFLKTLMQKLGKEVPSINRRVIDRICTGTWSRHLSVDDKDAYLIGGSCDTCEFVFERMDGANKKIFPSDMGDLLCGGLTHVSEDVLETCSTVMPSGTYYIVITFVVKTSNRVVLESPRVTNRVCFFETNTYRFVML